jgi:hypothetical protein
MAADRRSEGVAWPFGELRLSFYVLRVSFYVHRRSGRLGAPFVVRR